MPERKPTTQNRTKQKMFAKINLYNLKFVINIDELSGRD